MALDTFKIKLIATTRIAPGVSHFQFKRVDQQAFSFIPGQFITLMLPHNEKIIRRSYSIASIPGQNDTLDFAASFVSGGIASELLFHLDIGAELEASGPAGRLVLREEDQPSRYILIATGTGITPYRSMLPLLEKRIQEHQTRIVIMEGVRVQQDLLYKDDFLEYAAKYPEHFQFGAYYSRYAGSGLFPYEHAGNVCQNVAALKPQPQTDIVYLCGNPNMIDQAFELLKEMGFDTNHVRREKYISSSSGSR